MTSSEFHYSGSGFVLWMTGMSGAGKSTLAGELAPVLRARTGRVEVLDGDAVRASLSRDLGFSKADRDANVKRIGFVANLLARNGVAVIVAAISPYRATREELRRTTTGFVEVHVDCELDVLIERDVKGLYAEAIAGRIQEFTGISAPYEAPLDPEIYVNSSRADVAESAATILARLSELGCLSPLPAVAR